MKKELNSKNPRDYARDLIEVYVLRGESLEQLRRGQMGYANSEYWASIGGYMNGKKYTTDKIIVSKINGEDCEYVFDLKDIYNEIKSGTQELNLFV